MPGLPKPYEVNRQDRRKFGDRFYTFVNFTQGGRSQAANHAKKIRKHGYDARVVKVFGTTKRGATYGVFARKRRR